MTDLDWREHISPKDTSTYLRSERAYCKKEEEMFYRAEGATKESARAMVLQKRQEFLTKYLEIGEVK